MDVSTSKEEFRALDLQAHDVMAGVPLHEVNVIDLPGGGSGCTLLDLRSILSSHSLRRANPAVRLLFGLRAVLDRVFFRWDHRPQKSRAKSSFVQQLKPEVRARSLIAPGSPDGPFSVVYLLENESLAELQSAAAHLFIASVLKPTDGGYRFYWAFYVPSDSGLTPFNETFLAPFRRFIVCPVLFRRVGQAWRAHHGLRGLSPRPAS